MYNAGHMCRGRGVRLNYRLMFSICGEDKGLAKKVVPPYNRESNTLRVSN